MREHEPLSRLIGCIYDAALEPSQWAKALRLTAQFVEGAAAALFWKDASGGNGNLFYHDGGIPSEFIRQYFSDYIKIDPATSGQYFAAVGEPIATKDLMPYAEFLETRFYKEWAQPQGLVDFVGAVLEKNGTGASMVGVFRHQRHGLVNEEARRRMRMIVPHFRRTILIGSIIDVKQADAAALADACNGLAAGMLLVDAEGRISHANAAGQAMLAKQEILSQVGGRLMAIDPEINRHLHQIFRAAAEGDCSVGTSGIAVVLSGRDSERHVAHVLPLTNGARRRAGANYAAVAALFVHKAALDTRSPIETIAKQYRLTPTELRVLLALVEVGGVPQVADALGISETTVKSHLGHLYEKIGVHRQADLVKLVAGFASPLAS